MDPKEQSIKILDIAHALSNLCRFIGQCDRFYSVAQHSIHTSLMVQTDDPKIELMALLHDASEAYIGDVSSPLKQLLPEYQEIEKNIQSAIMSKFGLPSELPEQIKEVDLRMLATEKRDLFQNDHHVTLDHLNPYEFKIIPMSSEKSAGIFIKYFDHLIRKMEDNT